MLTTDLAYLNMNDSLARSIKAKVEHYSGSTLLGTYSYNDALQNIHVDRTAASGKFFGFGVAQQLTLKLTDNERQKTVNQGDKFKIYFKANDSDYLRVCPTFTVDDVKRDEKTNGLTIIALDPINELSKHTFSELGISEGESTVEAILIACTGVLGLSSYSMDWGSVDSINDIAFPLNYNGTESLQEIMEDCAEVIHGVYFCDISVLGDCLKLKTLSPSDRTAITISKNQYFELTTQPEQVLTGIAHITELGDNIQAGEGTVQVIKDNGLLTAYDDIASVLDISLQQVSGLSIVPYNCSWRGNFIIQLGDRIAIEDKTGNTVKTYLLNDSFEYDGGFKQTCSWTYQQELVESAAPTTLGERLNQTSAKVDKVNNEIRLVVEETNITNETLSEMGNSIQELSSQFTQRADELEIAIERVESSGATSVTTSTNFTFNEDGLHISSTGKTDAELETVITEDGMAVKKEGNPVLVANNEGVMAIDLRATTYLIIGNNSRLQDYGSNRTACYWIGG